MFSWVSPEIGVYSRGVKACSEFVQELVEF